MKVNDHHSQDSATTVLLVQGMGDENLDKMLDRIVDFAWDANIRAARSPASELYVDLGEPLGTEELSRLERALVRPVQQVRDDPAAHGPWSWALQESCE